MSLLCDLGLVLTLSVPQCPYSKDLELKGWEERARGETRAWSMLGLQA